MESWWSRRICPGSRGCSPTNYLPYSCLLQRDRRQWFEKGNPRRERPVRVTSRPLPSVLSPARGPRRWSPERDGRGPGFTWGFVVVGSLFLSLYLRFGCPGLRRVLGSWSRRKQVYLLDSDGGSWRRSGSVVSPDTIVPFRDGPDRSRCVPVVPVRLVDEPTVSRVPSEVDPTQEDSQSLLCPSLRGTRSSTNVPTLQVYRRICFETHTRHSTPQYVILYNGYVNPKFDGGKVTDYTQPRPLCFCQIPTSRTGTPRTRTSPPQHLYPINDLPRHSFSTCRFRFPYVVKTGTPHSRRRPSRIISSIGTSLGTTVHS